MVLERHKPYRRAKAVFTEGFTFLKPYRTRTSRHEVATFTAEHEHIVNHDEVLCFATGILREQAPNASRLGSEASRTMEQTWKPQSGGALESDDMVKTK